MSKSNSLTELNLTGEPAKGPPSSAITFKQRNPSYAAVLASQLAAAERVLHVIAIADALEEAEIAVAKALEEAAKEKESKESEAKESEVMDETDNAGKGKVSNWGDEIPTPPEQPE